MPPFPDPGIRIFGDIFGDEQHTGLSQEWFVEVDKPVLYKAFQPARSYFPVYISSH